MYTCCVCGSSGGAMKRCSQCHKTIYCSPDCQRLDWKTHKQICTKSEFARTMNGEKVSINQTLPTGKQFLKYFSDESNEVQEAIPSYILELPPDTELTLKSNSKKMCMKVNNKWPGDYILKYISQETRIPYNNMKLIVKGKVQTASTILNSISDKATVMAIGTPIESADGLEERDIACLMYQLKITRKAAILALRKHSTLVDAMLYAGSV